MHDAADVEELGRELDRLARKEHRLHHVPVVQRPGGAAGPPSLALSPFEECADPECVRVRELLRTVRSLAAQFRADLMRLLVSYRQRSVRKPVPRPRRAAGTVE